MFYFLVILITDWTQGFEMLNSINPPHGCTNYGYCYPADRSTSELGEITCKGDCICPSGTIKVDQLTCDGGEKCTPTYCPNDVYYNCRTTSTTPKCVCKPGFTGSNCEIPIDSPCAVTPCLGKGTCSLDAKNTSYICTCDPGYYGDQCQYEGDPCINKKCRNGGTCLPIGGSEMALCKCPFQFYGNDCEQSRQVVNQYIDCFDDSSFDYPSTSYFLYSSSAKTGPECFSQLIQYRTANVDATYNIATLGTGNMCYFSDSNLLTKKPSCYFFMCKSCKSGNPSSGQAPVYELIEPCRTNPCGETNGQGKCIQIGPSFYECVCYAGWTGTKCQKGTKVSPCADISCGVGTCEVTKDSLGWYCQCPNGQKKKEECEYKPCESDPCQNGGTCVETASGYKCNCRNLYEGETCEIFNACHINECQNGGSCIAEPNLMNSTFTCKCTEDWRGSVCEIEIMPCDSNPCANAAECQNVRRGIFKDFYCECKVGWTSKDCSEDIDECVTLGPKLCDRRDSSANCTNLLNGEFKCDCGSMWFGKTCQINRIIYDILETAYGYVNDDDLERLTEDLMNDPTIVRDIIPFLIGNYNIEIRSNLSWNYEDFFIWAAYDEKKIDIGTDFVMWNDKVLGNCFTFNHHNSTVKYAAKRSGMAGGLALQASVRQDEYLPWIETATIMVFTHSGTETIFSESPRINCRENHEIQLDLLPNKFVRLGGLYGKCVNDVSEVASYYYGGSYTTDGCLRSCYQDVIKKECKCMDPRYPMPDDEVTCTLSQRNCIESISITRGDPSKWEECLCPLPCSNMQYQVAWKEASYVNQGLQYEQKKDMIILKAGLPSLIVKTFVEEPEMNVTSFISRLGGLLGVLSGICILTFIEFAFIILRVIFIVLSPK